MNFYDCMTPERIDEVCYTNKLYVKGEIKAVCTLFHGFENNNYRKTPLDCEYLLGEAGILTVYPYYSPWAWGNDRSMAYIDRCLELVFAEHKLGADTPLVIMGKSMGGLTAFAYSKHLNELQIYNVIACSLDCPVSDISKIDLFRGDCLRAFVDAFADSGLTLDECKERYSPINYVDKLLKVPYYILWSGHDSEVDRPSGAAAIIPKMRELGYDVTEDFQMWMEHCCPDGKPYDQQWGWIIEQVNKVQKD